MKSLSLQGGTARHLVLVLVLLALLAPAVLSEEAPPATVAGQPLTLTFSNTPVADVVRFLVIQTAGAQLVTDELPGTITIHLTDTTPEQALGIVCKQKGLHWWKDGGVYYVSTQPQATDAAAAMQPETAAKPALVYKNLPLKYMHPQDLAWLFGGATVPYTADFIKAFQQVNAPVPVGATSRIGSSSAGRTIRSPYDELKQVYPYNLPGTQVLPAGPTGAPTAAVPGQVQPTTGEEAVIQGPLSELLPPGMKPPVALPMMNAVIVQGSEDAIKAFRELVEMLDVKVKQVLIESQFVEIQMTEISQFGIDWQVTSPAFDVTTSGMRPPTGGNISISYGRPDANFRAQLAAALQNSRARIVAAPKVACMNGLSSSINFSTTYPFVLRTSVVQPGITGGQVTTGEEIQEVQVDSGLTVQPKINEDDTITAQVMPMITTIDSTTTTPAGNPLPITSNRSMQTMLRVKDGETIVMGGFVNSTQRTTRTRIPLLSDIPLIGKLFQSRDRNNVDSELLIFLTAHIIPDSTPGTLSNTTPEPVP